jgi:hypothetical protein
MKKNIIYFILPLLFFLYAFTVYKINFNGPDDPIYLAYTASIVDDGDFNVVNNIGLHDHYYFPAGKIHVSETYNLADYHNHGGVVFWAPFYIYGKSVYYIADKLKFSLLNKYGRQQIIECAMSFSTAVFGFLVLLFTYSLCRAFFTSKIAFWSTFSLFLGTPFFYYMQCETGNANIIASLFSVLTIWFCVYAIDVRKKSHWLLFGLFLSICFTIKTDLWFQMVFILALLAILTINKQATLREGLYFLIGLAGGHIPKVINDYIKYGVFREGHLGLFNLRDSYFFEQLFSSYRGFFYTSPVFYICVFGFLSLTIALIKNVRSADKDKMRDTLLFVLSLYVLIKLFVISFRYAWGGGSAGARQLLTEFPVFALLFCRAFQGRKKYIRYFLGISSVILVFWNLIIVSEFIRNLDWKYIRVFPGLSVRVASLKEALKCLFEARSLDLKIALFLPLLLLFILIIFYIFKSLKHNVSTFWHVSNQSRRPAFKALVIFTIYLFVSYTVFTALNLYTNKINIEKLKQEDFFKEAKIIGPFEFEKRENIDSMDEMIKYFELKGDSERANKIRLEKSNIYGENG